MTAATFEDTRGIVIDEVEDTEVIVRSMDEKMVRVGPPLGMYQHLDEWGHPTKSWEVFKPGWISRALWHEVQDFQREVPPLPPHFPVGILAEIMRDTPCWNEAPWAAEVDRKLRLNPEKGVKWTLVLHSGKYGLTSFDAILGQERVIHWSWVEANVGYPVLSAICGVTNFLHRRILGPLARFFKE